LLPIIWQQTASQICCQSVANSLFAGLRFRAALVAVLRGRRNFPRENFGFQDLCNKLLYDLTITFQLPASENSFGARDELPPKVDMPKVDMPKVDMPKVKTAVAKLPSPSTKHAPKPKTPEETRQMLAARKAFFEHMPPEKQAEWSPEQKRKWLTEP
jgi:hypothetical protein